MNSKYFPFFVAYFFTIQTSVYAKQENALEFGAWEMISTFECQEEHYFDGESNYKVISGDQILSKGYIITKLGSSGYWQLRSIVVDNNGKPDCLGRLDSEIGSELIVYFKFNKNKDEMHFFYEADELSYMELYLRKLLGTRQDYNYID